MDLEWKPKEDQLRLVFTRERPRCMDGESDNAVYAVIGPFTGFSGADHQADFKKALVTFVRGFNLQKPEDRAEGLPTMQPETNVSRPSRTT
jgi:hypothetical protein